MTVRMELGIAASSEAAAAAAAEAAASPSGLVTLLPLDSTVAVCCGCGEASAEAAKRRTTKDLRMVIVWAG